MAKANLTQTQRIFVARALEESMPERQEQSVEAYTEAKLIWLRTCQNVYNAIRQDWSAIGAVKFYADCGIADSQTHWELLNS